MLVERGERLVAVGGLGDDRELGPRSASFSLRRSRISGSSSAISAVGSASSCAQCARGRCRRRGARRVGCGVGANGSRMRATKPRGSFSSSSSDAASPYSSLRRSRMLASPMPCPARRRREAGTGVGDARRRAARRRSTRAAIVDAPAPGERLDAVLDRVLDQRDQHARRQRQRRRAPAARRSRQSSRRAEPRAHDREVRVDHRRPPRPASSHSSRSAGVAARRKRIRSAISRAASGAPFSASCCALPSVLNRKCGSTCDCSSFSSRLRELARQRRSAAPRPRGARVSAAYSRLRRCAISATSSDVQEARSRASAVNDVAQLRAVEDPARADRPPVDQPAMPDAAERADRCR